jgi:hypothetical protein
MIQPLRTTHRRAFFALALVLPAILLVGLGARHPRQRLSAPAAQLPNSAHLLRKSDSLWQKHAIQSEFYSYSNNPDAMFVVLNPVALHPTQEAIDPDLLLYSSAEQPQGDSVPVHARLLGVFIAGKVFTLPMSLGRAGYLVLFSLPHHTVFDTAKVETLP